MAIADHSGYSSLWRPLFTDLAASAFTIIFTALIIDYLGVREESSRTQGAAGLAEDEIKATCFRVRWVMARLFGLQRKNIGRDDISSREEAGKHLDRMTNEVDTYLSTYSMVEDNTRINASVFPKYLQRLQLAQTELEQTVLLYERAMPYSLREQVLTLRSELQIADHVLGFIDYSDSLSDENISLIRVISQSVYDLTEEVLGHHSRTESVPISAKGNRLT